LGGLVAVLSLKLYHVLLRQSRKGVIIINGNGKKMGRPITGEEPKCKRVSLRATETTVRKFDECSEKLQKTKTDLLEEMVDNLYDNVCKK
jgi:hypothetical protein